MPSTNDDIVPTARSKSPFLSRPRFTVVTRKCSRDHLRQHQLTQPRCRGKDASRALSPETSTQPPTPPETLPRPSLPPHGGAHSTPVIPSPAIRIPVDDHNAKPDLDPTEWKPKPPHNRHKSEAYCYLSRFHKSTTAIAELNEERNRKRSGASTPTSAMPSLANTPTTIASSWSVISSMKSDSGGVAAAGTGLEQQDPEEVHYSFNTRPLQPRHNPTSFFNTRPGTDLVTPHVPPSSMATARDAGSDDPAGLTMWEKKRVLKVAMRSEDESGSGSIGIGALFTSMK